MIGSMALLTGCATAKGPDFVKFEVPKENKSLLYIYRTSTTGFQIKPTIHKTNILTNEDDVIGFAEPQGYFYTDIDEGNYQIWAQTETKNEISINIEKNKIYCIEHYISLGLFAGHPEFKLINLSECEQEIKKTKRSGGF